MRPDSGGDLGQGGWLSSWSGSLSSCASLRQGLGQAWHCSWGPGESRTEMPILTSTGPLQSQALVWAVLGHKDDPGLNTTCWNSWPATGVDGLSIFSEKYGWGSLKL